eukprot:scaffold707_cov399-Prasinococcus_capsulatus_cf.AAC.19
MWAANGSVQFAPIMSTVRTLLIPISTRVAALGLPVVFLSELMLQIASGYRRKSREACSVVLHVWCTPVSDPWVAEDDLPQDGTSKVQEDCGLLGITLRSRAAFVCPRRRLAVELAVCLVASHPPSYLCDNGRFESVDPDDFIPWMGLPLCRNLVHRSLRALWAISSPGLRYEAHKADYEGSGSLPSVPSSDHDRIPRGVLGYSNDDRGASGIQHRGDHIHHDCCV